VAASQREVADERWLRVGLVLWRSARTLLLKAAVETDVATKADLQELKADMYKAMVSQTVILLGFVFTMLKFM